MPKHLGVFADTVAPPVKEELPSKKKKKQNKNNPHFHLAEELQRITGVDLTRIDGVDVMVAQTVISEVGLDMSPRKTEAHFASWLGLCPDNRISGGKVLARGTRHALNRTATALRLGASTLLKSQTYLGAPKAITAMAHRLARLVYRMLKCRLSKMAEARLRVERGVFRSPQTRRLREGRDFSGLAVLRTLSIYPDKFPKPTDTATDTVICFKFQGQWQRVRIAAVCNRVRKRLSWW